MTPNIQSIIREKAAALKAEQQKLANERDRIDAKSKALERQLANLETTEATLRDLGISDPNENAISPAATFASPRRSITKREQILTVAVEMLKTGTKRTDEILDGLEKNDVSVAGEDRKDQIRNLSAYLSRAKGDLGLEPSRNGWSLSAQQSENPAATGSSSATMSAPDEP